MKDNKEVWLQIKDRADRRTLIGILVDNGYPTRIERPIKFYPAKGYLYVVVEIPKKLIYEAKK